MLTQKSDSRWCLTSGGRLFLPCRHWLKKTWLGQVDQLLWEFLMAGSACVCGLGFLGPRFWFELLMTFFDMRCYGWKLVESWNLGNWYLFSWPFEHSFFASAPSCLTVVSYRTPFEIFASPKLSKVPGQNFCSQWRVVPKVFTGIQQLFEPQSCCAAHVKSFWTSGRDSWETKSASVPTPHQRRQAILSQTHLAQILLS